MATGLLEPPEDLLALGADSGLEALVNTPGDLNGVVDLLTRGEEALGNLDAPCSQLLTALDAQLLVQAQLKGLLVVIRQEGVEEVDIAVA